MISIHVIINVNLNSLTNRCLKRWDAKESFLERILTVARVQRWQNSSVFPAGFCILRKICKVFTPNPQAKPCRFCTFLMKKSRDDEPGCIS